jgi:SAM-dependent methyltransferase
MPPEELVFVGGGDFKAIGEAFVGHFVDLCALSPDECVLEVGCGVGRIAAALTRYLSPKGSYEGFDVAPDGIDWCNQAIAARFANFRFSRADVYNKQYNPSGSLDAEDYVFPFDDDSFDFVFLTSVFTHMLPEDVEQYLAQIARVLRPGGRCLITYFLLNEESLGLLAAGRGRRWTFPHDHGVFRTELHDVHEAVVAYREDFVRTQYARVGLRVRQPIHYGRWCGRAEFLSGQDVVVADA